MAAARAERHDAIHATRAAEELARWRGQTDERIDRLIEACETQNNELKDEREDARKHRQALREVIGSLSLSVANLAEAVKRMEPTVADYRDKAAEGRGAAKLAKVLWAVLLGLGGLIGGLIVELARRL